MKNDEKQMSFIFMDDNQNCGEKTKKNNLQNINASLYEILRLKLGDFFNFHFKFLFEEITKALNSKKKSDLYRNLLDAEQRALMFCQYSRVINDTYTKNKLNEDDYKNIQIFYGKEIADYERLKRESNHE